MIRFQNVVKRYGAEKTAIDDVSFTINDGEFVILLGPSGCGKTTLLRMVNQLESISGGDIILNGKSVKDANIIEMRRKIGYVIQSNGLFPNMTIEENVMAVPNLIGWDRVKQRERYVFLMELIGLNPDEYRKRYPHELSGGQQQRVGVARALAADPPVMLMDEPFGALDPIIRTRLQEEFLQIQREVKKTILFVSHDIDEAVKMGDRIALLRGGKMMQYDRPEEILSRPKNDFVSEFVGEDRTLKSMELYTIQDLCKQCVLKPGVITQQSKMIEDTTSLRTAISLLLNQGAGQLVIVDKHGHSKGNLTFDLIDEFLRKEVRGSAV